MSLPVVEAARELGMRPGTLRRMIRTGCPTVNRGRRGRGHATRVDVAQVRQWLGADVRERAAQEAADAAVAALAAAMREAWRQADGLPKGRLAGIFAASWYSTACAVIDRLREMNPAIPEIDRLPPEIESLRKIAENR